MEEISARLDKPLFWVRMSVRELVGAGLVRSDKGKFLTTDQGRAKL